MAICHIRQNISYSVCPSFSWFAMVRNCQIVFITTFPSAEYSVSHTVNAQHLSKRNIYRLFCGFRALFWQKFYHLLAFSASCKSRLTYHRKCVCACACMVHVHLYFQSSVYIYAVIWFANQHYKVILFPSGRWRNRSLKILTGTSQASGVCE